MTPDPSRVRKHADSTTIAPCPHSSRGAKRVASLPLTLLLISLTLPACQSIHSDLPAVELDQRLQNHFHQGMSHDQTRSKIRGLGLDPEDAPAGDLYCILKPQDRPLLFDYEGRRQLLFRFNGDTGLDDILYDRTHTIPLDAE